MSGPWDDYKKQPEQGPWSEYAPPEQEGDVIGDAANLAGRFGVNVVRGAAQLPGVPLELMVAGGNFLRRQMGAPEVDLEQTLAKDWGTKGWLNALERNVGKANLPEATTEFERSVDKAGQFVGGGLPFGPAGLLPSATAYLGSEAGRKLDEADVTGGYGETVGAIAGGMGPGLVRGQVTAGASRAPTNDQLRTLANQAYQRAENAGVIVSPQGGNRLAHAVRNDLTALGYNPRLHPRVGAVLDELDNATTGNTTLQGIDQLRRVASNASQTLDRSERAIATRIINQIDDFVETLQPADIVAGNAQVGAQALNEARGFWSRLRKSETVDEALTKAERRAASTGSGGNADNATRQNIRAILDNPRLSRGFTQAERAIMERVVRGTYPQNFLRLVGKLSPQGNGLMAALGIGATAGAPTVGWIPSAIGMAAKPLAEAMTRRNVAHLQNAVRTGPRNLTPAQRANELWLELQRRAALARQSTTPAVPGTVYQEQ